MKTINESYADASRRPQGDMPGASVAGTIDPEVNHGIWDQALAAMGEAVRTSPQSDFQPGSRSKVENDDFDRHVGKRLAQARTILGLSIDAASESLKVSPQTLYKYEKGERTVKAKTLFDASRLYGVDGNWLLCLTDKLQVTRKDDEGRIVTVTYQAGV